MSNDFGALSSVLAGLLLTSVGVWLGASDPVLLTLMWFPMGLLSLRGIHAME